jgi:hypothetical protein
VGLLALLVPVLGAAFHFSRRSRNRRKKFGVLTGTYRVTRKEGDQPEPYRIVSRRHGNKLKITYLGLPPGNTATGTITMDDRSPSRGAGDYEHLQNGKQLWGTHSLQVAPGGDL